MLVEAAKVPKPVAKKDAVVCVRACVLKGSQVCPSGFKEQTLGAPEEGEGEGRVSEKRM